MKDLEIVDLYKEIKEFVDYLEKTYEKAKNDTGDNKNE